MEIDVAGRHFHVSEPLMEYAIEKTRKLDKYTLKLEHAHVIFEVQKYAHIAEIVLTGKNLRLAAKGKGLDMYAAFDKTMDNIQVQLSKKHDKVRDHKGRRYLVAGSAKNAPRKGME